MRLLPTRLDGPILIEPDVHGDPRGFFMESFRESWLDDAGIDVSFVQDNHSRSTRGVLRGLHAQTDPGQAKLVRCARGCIWDVIVDIRSPSPTFGEWEGFTLDDESGHILYVPVGFAHGFIVMSDVADVIYRCSAYYDPDTEITVAFDDPDIGITWPDETATVSARDAAAPRLAEIAASLPW